MVLLQNVQVLSFCKDVTALRYVVTSHYVQGQDLVLRVEMVFLERWWTEFWCCALYDCDKEKCASGAFFTYREYLPRVVFHTHRNVQCHSSHRLVLSAVFVPSDALRRHLASCSECTPLSVVVMSAGGRANIYTIRVVAPCCLRTVLLCGFCSVSSDDAMAVVFHPLLDMDDKSCSVNYKVVQIWPGQTVTCLHTNSPSHIWTTLYMTRLVSSDMIV